MQKLTKQRKSLAFQPRLQAVAGGQRLRLI
jgi:hypothetical protein